MRIIFFISLLIGFWACQPTEIAPTFQDLPVVEGYLKEGESITFKISRQVAIDENAVYSSDNIDALQPKLYENDVLLALSAQGNGIYSTPEKAKAGKTYRLTFTYNQKEVSATTIVPTTPENYQQSVTSIKALSLGSGGIPDIPEPIKLSWDNFDNSYYVVIIENVESSPEAINESAGTPPSRIFRNQPTQGNSYEIRVVQFSYYGKHHLKLYKINPDYAVLYDSGSNTSQNLFAPTSNISNGVGIFTGMAGKVLDLNVTR